MRFHKAILAKLLLLLTTFAGSSDPCFAGAESAGGGDLMHPIQPHLPFEYRCSLTWIADIGRVVPKSPGAAISYAEFTLKNDRVAYNKSDLQWKNGYTNSLYPFQYVSKPNGSGEALAQSVTPYGVAMHFMFSGIDSARNTQGAYISVLELTYGINKGESSHSTVTSSSRALMSDPVILVEGGTYSNGVGENQMPYRFGLKCERISPEK